MGVSKALPEWCSPMNYYFRGFIAADLATMDAMVNDWVQAGGLPPTVYVVEDWVRRITSDIPQGYEYMTHVGFHSQDVPPGFDS